MEWLSRRQTSWSLEKSIMSLLVQGKRTDAFNHSKAVAEAIPALSWVVYSGPNCGEDILICRINLCQKNALHIPEATAAQKVPRLHGCEQQVPNACLRMDSAGEAYQEHLAEHEFAHIQGSGLWALCQSFDAAVGMDLPVKHVDNTMQSAEFWTNKVLLADRSAPSQEWASHPPSSPVGGP